MKKNTSQIHIWHRIIDKLNEVNVKYVIVGAAALKKLFLIAEKLNLKSEQEDILRISHSPRLFVNEPFDAAKTKAQGLAEEAFSLIVLI